MLRRRALFCAPAERSGVSAGTPPHAAVLCRRLAWTPYLVTLSRRCSCRRAGLLLVHQGGEAVEQIGNVVRARRCFRVALEAEGRLVGEREALQRAVEQRHVRGARVGGQRGRVDCEAGTREILGPPESE